ncbi:MAG: MFS transporter [Dehalococcoidia bacterium]
MSQAKPPGHVFPFYYGWAIVTAAFLEHVLAVGITNSQGVFLKPISADFGWTRGATAGAFALASIMTGLFVPVMGALTDKYGPRILATGQGVFMALGYLLISQTGSPWQFYLFCALFLGIGKSAGWGSIQPTIPRWFEAKRGLAQGIVQAGGGLGSVLMPLAVTFLMVSFGWRDTYMITALFLAVLLIPLAQILRRHPQEMGLLPDGRAEPVEKAGKGYLPLSPQGLTPGSGQGFTMRQALATHTLWQLFFIAIAASFAHQLVIIHLVPHATDTGLSPVRAATLMSVLGISNIVGKLTMGTVSDRIGRRAAMTLSFSLAATMLFWVVVARGSWSLYIFAAIFGFGYGGWMPMFPTITADLFGVGSLGAIYGLVGTSMSIGWGLGAFLGGYIFDVTQSYNYAFLLAAMLLLGGIGLLLTLRPPKKTP